MAFIGRLDLGEDAIALTLGLVDDLLRTLALLKEVVALLLGIAAEALALGAGQGDIASEASLRPPIGVEDVLSVAPKLDLRSSAARPAR